MTQRLKSALTFRSLVVGVFCMVVMAMWVHFHSVLASNGQPLAENSPPTAAVGVFLGVLLMVIFVQLLAKRAAMSRSELMAVYAMLVVAAPLMSQGMWHRFLGFVSAVPHHKHNMVLLDSYSDRLWPHGPPLIQDPRFELGLTGLVSSDTPENVTLVEVTQSQVGPTSALRLSNPAEADGRGHAVTNLRIRVPRNQDGQQRLIPGEQYFLAALVRLEGMTSQSRLTLEIAPQAGQPQVVFVMAQNTSAAFSRPGAFVRDGEPYVSMPRNLGEHLDIVFTLQGPGVATITDVKFFSNEALARMHKGSSEVAAGDLQRLAEDDRASLLVRPDNLASPEGIWYSLKGYVLYRQWLTPMLYWGSIVLAIFLSTMALGAIFRKQWADHERLGFPLIVLPRLLLEQRDEGGRLIRPLFHNRAFYIGAGLALFYSVFLGLAYYIPGMPNPQINVVLSDYVSSPTITAMINGMGGQTTFRVVLLFLAIAFFVDLQLLASVLIFFALSMVPWGLGEVFGWKHISGPQGNFPFPHEQQIGAFLALALVVLWVSRRHLSGVVRQALRLPGGSDDSSEPMRYRTAILMLIGCFAFFAWWGHSSGLGANSALIFFGFMVLCALVAARIRSEFGAPGAYFTPYFPFLIFYLMGGLAVFGTETMLLIYFAGGFMAVAQFLMFAPSQVEMMQLGRETQAKPTHVNLALIIGALGGLLLGGYVMLVWAYGVGGDNIEFMRSWAMRQDWYLSSLRQNIMAMDRATVGNAQGGTDGFLGSWIAVGVGTGITVLLAVLRNLFVGFWLHPIGYVLANTHFMYGMWGSILVAWAIKWTAIRVGGPSMVRQYLTPGFAGVFVGAVGGVILWDVVALVLMIQGQHEVTVILP